MNQAEMWAEVVGNLNRAYGQSWTEEGQHVAGQQANPWPTVRPVVAPVAQETGWKARNAARAAAWEAGRKGR